MQAAPADRNDPARQKTPGTAKAGMWLDAALAGIHRRAGGHVRHDGALHSPGRPVGHIAESTGRRDDVPFLRLRRPDRLGPDRDRRSRPQRLLRGILPAPSPPALQLLFRSGEPRSRCSFSISGGLTAFRATEVRADCCFPSGRWEDQLQKTWGINWWVGQQLLA